MRQTLRQSVSIDADFERCDTVGARVRRFD
jgi:hypothetical protein